MMSTILGEELLFQYKAVTLSETAVTATTVTTTIVVELKCGQAIGCTSAFLVARSFGVASAISIWQFVEKCGVYKSLYIAQNGLLPLVEREG